MSNASALEVDVHDGCVCLNGPILSPEAFGLVQAIRGIPGVRRIEDRLEKHEPRGNISALQGRGCRTGQSRFDFLQANWAPGTRLIAATTGGLLMANCLARRTPSGLLMGTLGLALFTRAMTNMDTPRALGASASRRAIDIQNGIEIAALAENTQDGAAHQSGVSFHGPGAPTDDALMSQLHHRGSRPPWPPSPAEEPAHAGIPEGRFPPSI